MQLKIDKKQPKVGSMQPVELIKFFARREKFMKLADNLKRIRRENNLSQEQLAEKLGVSRQAVSKWESEQSYPEMDKVLLICKLFNYNIDELMNENVKEVDENKESKNNFNRYIEDFFAFITKTVDMLSSMTMKQRLKCLVEQFIVGIFLAAIFVIIGGVLYQALSLEQIMGELGLGKIVLSIVKSVCSLYYVFALIVGIAVLLHVFKIRYLDYYEIVKEEENNGSEENSENNEQEVNENIVKDKHKIFIEKKKEKVIIRDPKHSESKFLNGIMRAILWCIKFIVAFVAIGFVFTFISLVALFVLSFLFVKTGLAFVGAAIGIIAGILVNFVVLEVLYNFIISKKSKKSRIAVILIIALLLAGIGIGMFCIGITEFDYIYNLENAEETVFEIQMVDNLSINYWNNVEYIEAEIDNIKIVVKHPNHLEAYAENDNEIINIGYRPKNENIMQEIRDSINDINNKKIRNYYPTVYVYASKGNIEKLISNGKRKYEENQINELESQNMELKEQNDIMKDIIDMKDEEIMQLREQLQIVE